VDNDEDEDEEDEEGNDGESVPDLQCPSLQLYLSGGFIDDEPATNLNPQNTPVRQMDQTSDQEGGWHDFVASLEERCVSGSEFKAKHHIAKDDYRNERPLIDPVIVSSIENIITHDYPFWRVRCKVSH
jgi:hypothetical protein